MSDLKPSAERHPRKPPLWRRRWFVILTGAFLLLVIVGTVAGEPEEGTSTQPDTGSDTATSTSTPTPTQTASPEERARIAADALAADGQYADAVAALEDAGLEGDAKRVARDGATTLHRRARVALDEERYVEARRIARRARRLHGSAAITAVLDTAAAEIAVQRAAAREQRRQKRLARDRRTCTSAEKQRVRSGGATPAGCTAFAAQFAAREAEEQASQCDPNYAGACLDPNSPDYDCEGGSGDGPDYTGTVQVVGADPYDLDRDGDGIACDT